MLDDRALSKCGMRCASSLALDAVTESKDVLKALVLKSIRVDVDHASAIGDASFDQLGVRLRSRIDVRVVEWNLCSGSSINVSEACDFLAVFIVGDFRHLPAEVDIDATLEAFLEGDFIRVREFEDLLVRSEVLDASISRRSALDLVLSEERFVVKSIEVASLALVWGLGRVADHVASVMVPSVLIVTISSILVVEHVHEDVFALRSSLHFRQSFDSIFGVIEASCNNESLVSVLSAVRKLDLVLVGHVLNDFGADVRARRRVNLRADCTSLKVERSNVMMHDTEVSLRDDVLSSVGDQGHLPEVVDIVLLSLDELSQGRCVGTAYKIGYN